MSQETDANVEGVDFALVAYREEGVWRVQELDARRPRTSTRSPRELRRYPGDGGALGLVSVDEDFFLLLRVPGAESGCCSPTSPPPTDWPLAALRAWTTSSLPDARRRGRPGAGRRPRHRRRPGHARRWTWARCSTTSTSTPTRCSATSPRRLGLRPSCSTTLVGLSPAVSAVGRAGTPAMREALDEARAALATDDVPIGAVVLDASGAVVGRGRNVREADADPTGARRGGRPAGGGRRPRASGG